VRINVKLFARASELAGTNELELDLPQSARVADIRTALAAQLPDLAPLVPQLLVAVGTDYADDAQPLFSNAEVSCFPPVSGG